MYVRAHLERALAPLLLTEHQPEQAMQQRANIVAPARRSTAGERKIQQQRTDQSAPAHSLQELLADL